MKKLLTVLSLTSITISSIFAVVAPSSAGKSAQVQLNTSIEESEVSYKLAYGDVTLADGIEKYDINIDAPLTKDGKTDTFTVYASSNKNSDMSVSVKVSPESFQTTLNGGTEDFDSKITPSVNTYTSLETIAAGLHSNLLVNKFNMSWNGNDELPAGDYVSNVKIEYTIK